MRPLLIPSVVILTMATPVATPVFAQVTVDLHALQALPEHPAASHSSRQTPSAGAAPAPSTGTQGFVATREHQAPAAATQHPAAQATAPEATAPPASTAAATPAPAAPLVHPPAARPAQPPAATPAQPPAMPENAPAVASLTPIEPPVPSAATKQPAPPPISDKAATEAAPTTSGLRVTFAPGESDLSPESVASIKQLTTATPPSDSTTYNVLAYAPGKPDDPSTARRISLSRAMAVRSALVANGVPSARIFVRALGEQFGSGPPDRVDLNVVGSSTPASTAAVR